MRHGGNEVNLFSSAEFTQGFQLEIQPQLLASNFFHQGFANRFIRFGFNCLSKFRDFVFQLYGQWLGLVLFHQTINHWVFGAGEKLQRLSGSRKVLEFTGLVSGIHRHFDC